MTEAAPSGGSLMGWRPKIRGWGSRVVRNHGCVNSGPTARRGPTESAPTETEPVLVVVWERKGPWRGRPPSWVQPTAPHSRLTQEGAPGPRLDKRNYLGWHAGCSKSGPWVPCAQDPPTPRGQQGPKSRLLLTSFLGHC